MMSNSASILSPQGNNNAVDVSRSATERAKSPTCNDMALVLMYNKYYKEACKPQNRQETPQFYAMQA